MSVTTLYQSQGRSCPLSNDSLRRSSGTPQPLHARTFFITNATDAVALHTAQLLAFTGCTVLLQGKSAEKVDKAVKELQRLTGNSQVHGFAADLSLMSGVRELAKNVSSRHPAIHGLLYCTETFQGNSLGRRLTSEDKEYSLAVNVMAPFLLLSLLLDSLKASGSARVLITTTMSIPESDQAIADIHDYFWYDKRWSYSRACEMSKLCGQMIVMEMHQRFANPPKLCFHSLDPGTIDTTYEDSPKMLRGTWSHAGTSVRTISADRSFQMLTEDQFQQTSGETLCCGSGGTDQTRDKLWKDLEALTGAQYPARKSLSNK